MVKNLSFVTLLAYDYKSAFQAIKSYYKFADEIILGIDKDYISWAGNSFHFNEAEFKKFIKKIDVEKKIKIIRANFHNMASPIKNDTSERNFLSLKCKPDNWIIQIDADEILLNPEEFVSWLKNVPSGFVIKASWITVFKCFENSPDCLVIDNSEQAFVGTKKQNIYTVCRETNEPQLKSPLKMLHFSWGRKRDELKQKLDNWSHSRDFNTKAYLKFWDNVNLKNYKTFKNIHPINGPVWPELKIANINKLLRIS